MGACAKSKSIDPSIYFTVLEVGYGITVPAGPGYGAFPDLAGTRQCRHLHLVLQPSPAGLQR